MNDRFKFRAWTLHSKQMLQPTAVNPINGTIHVSRVQLHDIEGEDVLLYPKSFTLMQSTGLKDMNGRLIYEGDIVEFEEPIFESAVLKCEVVFFVGTFCALWDREDRQDYIPLSEIGERIGDHYGEIEVIGNIYKNPELLNAA